MSTILRGILQSLPLKLRVEVLRAQNLAPADANGRSDPYCVVSVGHKNVQTSVQSQTLNPEWMQSIVFFSDDLAPFALVQETLASDKCSILLLGYLMVDVWDRDIGNPDDFLGRVILPLSSFPLCPSDKAEASKERWYPLSRNSAKGEVRGDVQLKIQLEAIEPNVELANPSINLDLLTITKGLGFQVPVHLNTQIVDFPGVTEAIEIGFSKVYVDLCAYHSEAMIILTNYRLIILSSGDMKGNRFLSSSALPTHNISTDVSMWIALSNIAYVEHGTGNTVVRRLASGTVENVESYSVKLYCYDCRSIHLTFVMESEKSSSSLTVLRRSEDRPILPKKLVKQVSEFEKQIRKRRKEVKLKKRMKYLKKVLSSKPAMREKQWVVEERRRRSEAFSTTENQILLPHERGSCASALITTEQKEPGEEGEEKEEEEDEEGDDIDLDEDKSLLLTLKHFSVVSDQDQVDTQPLEEEEEEEDVFLAKPKIQELESAYQGLTLPPPTRILVDKFITRLDDIVFNIVKSPPAFVFTSSELIHDTSLDTDWNIELLVQSDMTRLMNEKWRECLINSEYQYTLCPSYPPIVYVPTDVRDELITEVIKFRSKGRIPTLVWMDKTSGSFLLRSAQPLPGLSDKHSIEDESLIKYALATYSNEGEGLTIFDARSSSAATGNRIMGKGTEDISRYNGCKLTHLDIPNIHAVRESFEGVKQLALSTTSSKWLSTLENTQWLEYISLLLKGSFLIARLIALQSGSALVHCSDGWDRTSQLTSLAQIMIDPHYRTIDGFMTLIAKEWLAYGHKFRDRLGDPLHPNERSPIFFQFLDCVHQMLNQYPRAFQFNMCFLLFIAEHLHTAWFGTFLFNCHHERLGNKVFTHTIPLEAHFAAVKEAYINPKYKQTKELILPTWTVRRLRLWEEYFLACDGTSIASQIDMVNGLEGLTDFTPQATGERFNNSETVVWMSDDKTKSCLHCHKKFALLRRKHHCRKCGRIFCDDCSKHHASLPSLGYSEPVRVCNDCYKELSSTQNIQQFTEDDYQIIEHKQK